MSGRAVFVRDDDRKVLGAYEVRADGRTCFWIVRRTSGYAACIADATHMIRRVAAIFDRRDNDGKPNAPTPVAARAALRRE